MAARDHLAAIDPDADPHEYRVTIAKTRKGWTVSAGTRVDMREINSYFTEERAILAARHIRSAATRYDGVTRLAP